MFCAAGIQWQEILRSLKASFGGTDLLAKVQDGSLRHTFDGMDADGSGALEVGEVLEVMRKLGGGGKALTRGSVANLVRLADDDGSGSIDYQEFEAIVLRLV